MELKSEILIEGFKAFRGEVEGTSHDNLSIYVLQPLKSNQNTTTGGQMTVAYKFNQEGSRFANHLRGLEFPARAVITLEVQSKIVNKEPVQELVPVDLEIIGDSSRDLTKADASTAAGKAVASKDKATA